MTKTNWYQRLVEAKRTIERIARAAEDSSPRRTGATNIRVAAQRNVKVVSNVGQPHSTQAAVAQQVAPIHQAHRSGTPDDGATRSGHEGGDAAHESGRA